MERISVEDKGTFKKAVRDLLSSVIIKPNNGVLEVAVAYDPNLEVVTLSYSSTDLEERVIVFDETV